MNIKINPEDLKVMQNLYPGGENPVFRGEYTPEVKKLTFPSGYSVNRDGAVGISVYALAASGKYTFEQIMDPEQLGEEKRAMYEFVLTKIKNAAPMGTNDENHEWIARQIFEGRNRVREMMDEEYKKVDYSNPRILADKRFCYLANMAMLDFDCWQEASNCKEAIVKLAREKDPGITNFTDFKDKWTSEEPAFGGIAEAVDRLAEAIPNVLEGNLEPQEIKAKFAHVVGSAYFLEHKVNEFKEATSKDPIPNMNEWYTVDNALAGGTIQSVMQDKIDDNMMFLINEPILGPVLMRQALDGDLLKNVSFDTNTLELKGWPSEKELREKYTNEKDFNDLSAAMSEFDTKRTDWWLSKESPVHKALRESAESLKSDLDTLKYGVYKDGPEKGKPLSIKDRRALLESVEKKTEQVEKDADKYLSERKGTRGTEAGNKRKAGAQKIKDIAGSVREKYASELKELRIKDEVAKLDEIKSRSKYYSRFDYLFSGMGDFSSQEAQEKFVTDFVGGISYKFADVEVARGNLTADKVEKSMGRISSDFYNDRTLMNWAKELSKNSEKRDELRGSSVGEIYAKYQSMRSKALKQSEPRNAAPERKAQMQKKAPAPKAPGM